MNYRVTFIERETGESDSTYWEHKEAAVLAGETIAQYMAMPGTLVTVYFQGTSMYRVVATFQA